MKSSFTMSLGKIEVELYFFLGNNSLYFSLLLLSVSINAIEGNPNRWMELLNNVNTELNISSLYFFFIETISENWLCQIQ